MQTCPNCQTDHQEGVVYCQHCGFALAAVSIGTRQLDRPDGRVAGGDHLADEHVILLHLAEYDDAIPLQVIDQLMIGREGGEAATVPFLSLEPYRAADQGVSRQHALLIREHDQLYLRDLESTNHVYLNDQQIAIGRDYVLHDGDSIALGRLKMRIFFK